MQNAQREPQNKCLSHCFRFFARMKTQHRRMYIHTYKNTHTITNIAMHTCMHALKHQYSFTHFEIRPTACINVCQVVYRDGNCSPLCLCSYTDSDCFCWNVIDSLENIGVLYCCKHELLTGKKQVNSNWNLTQHPILVMERKVLRKLFFHFNSFFLSNCLNQLNIFNLNTIWINWI